ncbi:tRNA-splicing endonuclease subunit Sen15 [Acrasis kona]|uniref:tRNA-splicing endonuclease subunit Sen15 n=1 Tax=Acrasis kona TaxID=1008807 RepID=A0AAW2Z9X2_9EUKA
METLKYPSQLEEADFGEVRRQECLLVHTDLKYMKKQPNMKPHKLEIFPNHVNKRFCIRAEMTLPFDVEEERASIIIEDDKSKTRDPVIEFRQVKSTIIPVGTHESLSYQKIEELCKSVEGDEVCIAFVENDGQICYYNLRLSTADF